MIKLLKTSISIKSSRPPSVEMVGEIVAGEMRKKAVKPIIPLVLTTHRSYQTEISQANEQISLIWLVLK